ncbi:hypothetical protein C2845_PM16G02750 [Panicum miliaceum]|uniref:Uncharacterized protein n=1 Tax=Panicum miliaceum TaxID=4540 RepID=A0A3L6PWU0_PANMI|nr:hypothetical protein C2845_PM16G02750 [Panicum miliaceum]
MLQQPRLRRRLGDRPSRPLVEVKDLGSRRVSLPSDQPIQHGESRPMLLPSG